MKRRFAIKVIWSNGREEFLREGVIGGPIASFASRDEAQNRRDFLFEGITDEAQSINIVPFPENIA